MAIFDWALGQGSSANFNSKGSWFDEGEDINGKHYSGLGVRIPGLDLNGVAIPGTTDEINVAGNEQIKDTSNTIAAIHVYEPPNASGLSSVPAVEIDGSLTVTSSITFQSKLTGLRFNGSITLAGASTTLDLLQIGGPPLASAQKSLTVDDSGSFNLIGGTVNTGSLTVMNNAALSISGGGIVNVSGPMKVVNETYPTLVSVDGANSALNVNGNGQQAADLQLDGRIWLKHGATAKAETIEISSHGTASLNVGQYDGLAGTAQFTASSLSVGDINGGSGFVIAAPNGKVVVTQTIHMSDTVVDRQTFSGELTTEGGSIEVGNLGTAKADTIQIDPAGFTISLGGHGYVNTPTLMNNGGVEATGGLMLLSGNLKGNGVVLIDDQSTFEVGGSVDATSILAFAGKSGTLVLDQPSNFGGKILHLQLGDTIVLKNVGSALGNAIQSTNIVGTDGGDQFLALLRSDPSTNMLYRIAGQGSLAGERFEVTESADHKSTSLTLTSHGTTSSFYLDASGKVNVEFIWGDDKGGNTNVFINPDGTVALGANGLADRVEIWDYRNQQLNSVEVYSVASNGGLAYDKIYYDNSGLSALDPRLSVQLPTSPDPNSAHDLWYSYRHGPAASFATDDGLGLFQSYLASAWEVGKLVFDTIQPLFSAQTVSAAASIAEPAALSAPANQDWALTGQTWNQATGLLLSFTTEDFFHGQVSTNSSWVRNDDGSFTRTDTFPGTTASPVVGTYSFDYMTHHVIPLIASTGQLGQPPVQQSSSGVNSSNIGGLILGTQGSPASKLIGGLPVQGSLLLNEGGNGILTEDGAGIVSHDGGTIITDGGAGLTATAAAGIVAAGGGNIVAAGGGNIVAAGGGNIVAAGGGNIVAAGGGNIVAAGGGNALGISGSGTPGSYLANAVVFQDANGNGKLDNGEAWTITDANGHFQLYGGWGTLVLTGGTDTGTHLPFTATLTSPLGSTDISALTTLVDGLAKQSGTIDGAIKQVQTALGLDSKIDLTVIDPIASTMNGDAASAKIYVETSKVMDAIALVGAAFAGMGADRAAAQQAAFAAMVDQIAKNGTLNLSDKTTDSALIASVAGKLGLDAGKISAPLAGDIASSGQLLDSKLAAKGTGADLVHDIVAIETGVQGTLASNLQAAAGDPSKLGLVPLIFQAVSDNSKAIVTAGHVVTFTLTLSDTVTVTGAPTLQLDDKAVATYSSGSGTDTLVFKYTVQAGDSTAGLQVTGLNLPGGAAIAGSDGKGLAAPLTGSFGLQIGDNASIVAVDAVKAEGNAGTTAFTFSVNLDQAPASTQTVTWSVTGSGANPANAADFAGGVLPTGSVTFAPGETTKIITVLVAGDTIVEPDEGFTVTLSNPSTGLTIGTPSANGTIVNDDASVSLAALDAVKPEGNSGTTAFTFTATFVGDTSVAHSVAYGVTGSGANPANAADFAGGVLPAGSVTFAPGETTKIITVLVAGDTIVEPDEGFTVTLSNPSTGLTIGTPSANGTIVNDDASVSLAALDAVKPEGNSGTTAFTFTATFVGDTSVAHSVAYGVTGSGANPANAADFAGGVLPAGSVTFAPGETTKIITVLVAGDTIVEPDEGFTVTLSNPSTGLTIGTPSANGTIVNDDASVSLAALDAVKPEGNSGTTAFTFTATLVGDTSVAHSVAYAVAGTGANPANAGDFSGGVLPTGSVSFAPGETTKTVTVLVAGDAIVESDEGFVVTLSSPSAGLTIGTPSATGTIINDDKAAAVVAHDDAYVVLQGQSLNIGSTVGVLANDDNASTATLASGPAHGALQLSGNGGFTYGPTAGFAGIDSFTYHAGNASSSADGHALLYVVPTSTGASTTLNLLALTAQEQIAATYIAFFGRAADAAGFEFWVDQFRSGLPTQGAAALFANIASSFGVSDEAKGLYPFLVHPFGASDNQISAFLDSVYLNLFNRASDAAGLAYWTGQTKATLAAGQFVGSILVNIMSGAQNTADGQDISSLMGKVAVSLDYVQQQELHGTHWNGAADTAAATSLLHGITSDPATVLAGIKNADTLIANHA